MDKVAHFFGSAFITLALGQFVHWAIAAVIALAIGLLKELLDTPFNEKDVLANVCGVVLSTILLLF